MGQTEKIRTNISEELFKYAGLEIRFLLTSSDCNGTMSVFEFSVPASFKIPGPAHSNDGYEEMVYGLEGTLTWTVNDTDVQVGPGHALCIPRGAAHRWANNGTVPAKQLTVISPGVMGPEYFREVKAALGRRWAPRSGCNGRDHETSWDDSGRACTNSGEHPRIGRSNLRFRDFE